MRQISEVNDAPVQRNSISSIPAMIESEYASNDLFDEDFLTSE